MGRSRLISADKVMKATVTRRDRLFSVKLALAELYTPDPSPNRRMRWMGRSRLIAADKMMKTTVTRREHLSAGMFVRKNHRNPFSCDFVTRT
jgi:hypothetical protein